MTDIVENGNDPKYTSMMAIHQAMHAKPTEFADTINGLLADRLQNAVEKKREEVAKSIFSGEDQPVDTDDTDAVENETEETGELAPSGGQDPEAEVEKLPEVEAPEEPVEVEVPAEEPKEEVPAEE